MTDPEYPPFTPPVPGATAEQLHEFLAQQRNFGRGSFIRPDPDAEPYVPPAPEPRVRPEPSPVVWTGAPMPPPEQWAGPEDFGWSRTLSEGVCLALVHDRDPARALSSLVSLGEQFVATRRGTELISAPDAVAWAVEQIGGDGPYGTAVEAGLLGEWTLIVEDNGYLANCRETILPFSAGTAVCVVYWSMTGWHFWWVVGGTVVRAFGQDDYHDDDYPYEDRGTGRRLPQEDGLDHELHGNRAYGLALMQRLTGVRLTPGDITGNASRAGIGIHPG